MNNKGSSHKKIVIGFEISSAIFVILFGSFLHFTYELSGSNPYIGLVSAVNESVWEHLKLGFFAVLLFAIFEYIFIKKYVKNFVFAKAIAAVLMQVFIIVVFYFYTAISGADSLVVDILSYIISAIIATVISYKIITNKNNFPISYSVFGWLLIIGLTSAFMIFTYYPPKVPLFEEQSSGTYGAQWN